MDSNQLDNITRERIFEYLKKSYKIIQRLTETNRILTLKNKELFKRNLILESKIQELEKQSINQTINQTITQSIQKDDDFELV